LTTIPGIDELSACVILAEIGHDMSRFPIAGHLISWAGLCPRNDESAGKAPLHPNAQRSAVAQDHSRPMRLGRRPQEGQLLQAQFHRLRARRGAKKAIGAVAASILTAAYHMLKHDTLYADLGPATARARQ
jgi:transposase